MGLLAPHPTTNLEDHLLSAVRNCLLSIYKIQYGRQYDQDTVLSRNSMVKTQYCQEK